MHVGVAPWEEMKSLDLQNSLLPLSLATIHSVKSQSDENMDASDTDESYESCFRSSYHSRSDDNSSRNHSASSLFLTTLFQNCSVKDVDLVPDNAKPAPNVPLCHYLASPEREQEKRICRWTDSNTKDDTVLNRRSMNPITVERRARVNRSLSPARRPKKAAKEDTQKSDEHSTSSSDSSWSLLWERFSSKESMCEASISSSATNRDPSKTNKQLVGEMLLSIPKRRRSCDEVSIPRFDLLNEELRESDCDEVNDHETDANEGVSQSPHTEKRSNYDILEEATGVIGYLPLSGSFNELRHPSSPRNSRNTLRRQSFRAATGTSPRSSRRRHSSTVNKDLLIQSPIQPVRRKSLDEDDEEAIESFIASIDSSEVPDESVSHEIRPPLENIDEMDLKSPRSSARRKNREATSKMRRKSDPSLKSSRGASSRHVSSERLSASNSELNRHSFRDAEYERSQKRVERAAMLSSTRKVRSAPAVTSSELFSQSLQDGPSNSPSTRKKNSIRCCLEYKGPTCEKQLRSSTSPFSPSTRRRVTTIQSCDSPRQIVSELSSSGDTTPETHHLTLSSNRKEQLLQATRNTRSILTASPSKSFVPSKAFASPEQRTRGIASALGKMEKEPCGNDQSKLFVPSKAFASPEQRARSIETAFRDTRTGYPSDGEPWSPSTPGRKGRMRRKSIHPGRSPSASPRLTSPRASARRKKKTIMNASSCTDNGQTPEIGVNDTAIAKAENCSLADLLPSAPLE